MVNMKRQYLFPPDIKKEMKKKKHFKCTIKTFIQVFLENYLKANNKVTINVEKSHYLNLDVPEAPVVGVEEGLEGGEVLTFAAHPQIVTLVEHKGGPAQDRC